MNGYWGNVKDLSMSYLEFTERFTTNPSTSQPWTVAEVQSLQSGIHLNYLDFGGIRVTQVYVLVVVENPIVTIDRLMKTSR